MDIIIISTLPFNFINIYYEEDLFYIIFLVLLP